MSKKYTKLASDIIKNVGGKENVKDLRHCITRLRFHLYDESIANDEVLKDLDGVVTIVKAMGEYMVVIGEHVSDVFDEVCSQLGLQEKSSENVKEEKKSFLDKALGLIMASMGPTLNLLCACGIIKGINVIATLCGLPVDSGIYMLLNAAGDSLFYCLPLVLGFNAAKYSGIDPYFGLLLGAALSYPTIQGVDVNLFGFTVNATYTSSFLPVLFGLLAAVPLYKLIEKKMPAVIKGFMTPLLTLLIIFPLTFTLIGPFANYVGNVISVLLNFIFELSPIIGGIVLGAVWQILVMFGVHGVLVGFAFYDLIAGNPSVIIAISAIPCFAVAGALLGIFIKSKSTELKGIGLSSFISAIFGVTEPGMYGVIVPRKKIFAITCLGGAVGGLFIGLFKLRMYTFAGMGIIGMLGLMNPEGANFIGIALSICAPFITTLLLTLAVFKDNNSDEKEFKSVQKKDKKKGIIEIVMPVDGKVQSLSQCTDETFAQEILGKGCLIQPENSSVYSPVKGVVRTVFPTKHAIGIVSEDGVEILLHIGINTVNLNGKYFDAKVQQGDKVEQGQLLVDFDKDMIVKEGYSIETALVITNTNDYLDIVEIDHSQHKHGECILKVIG